MKNVNIKKVVAGAAALAIAAGSLGAVVSAANVADSSYTTPNGLARADMFNAQGAPSYNIVVGSTGHASDVVWAANIAAAIGKKAYNVSTASATGGDVVVEVGAEGTSVVSGDGKLFDDYVIGTKLLDQSMDEDDYSLLADYDVSVDLENAAGTSLLDDDINVKDSINLTATVAFDSDKDVADLTATINKKDIEYILEFNPAIPNGTTDDGSPDMKFNLMGKEYTVESWNGTNLVLVQNKATNPYNIGDTFEIEGHVIEVKSILENSAQEFEVEMSISKDGTLLSTDVYADGEQIFDDYLDIDTEIDTVYDSRVTIVSGTSAKVTLKHGTAIEDFPAIGDELWYADITAPGSDITKITIYNNDNDVQWKDEEALKVGDSIELPNDFAKIEFHGLTTESSKTLTVEDNVLSWTDYADDDHDIFMYEEESGSYEDGDTYTTSNEIDGKNLYITFDTTDADLTGVAYGGGAGSKGYFTVQLEDEDGKYLDYDATSWTWVTGAADATNKFAYVSGDYTPISIPLYNNEAVKIAYGVYISESASAETKIDQIAIGLAKGATSDIEESPAQKWTVGNIYFKIDDPTGDKTATFVGATLADDSTVATTDMKSMFELIVTDGQDSVTAHIDAYTGDLVNTDDSDYSASVDQVLVDNATGTDYTLNQEESDDLAWGYTNFGSKAEVDGGLFTIEIPESKLFGQIFIGGGSSSETTLNGGEVTLTTPGEVVETEDGKISVKLVSAPQGSATTYTPAAFGNIAYLDTDTLPAGNKIIVGGWMVNEQAKTLGLEDLVTKAGDFVAGKNAQGNIVVAGFHKEDTANAAKELISAIEAMN